MTTLAVKRTGPESDLPVVLIHAMPLDGSMWDAVRSMMDGIDVITVDAPGFGESPRGEELQARFGYDEPHIGVIVEALKATLDELGVERAIVGGMSMGGSVAAAFLKKYPETVAGLALMDTNIGADLPEHQEMRRVAIELCEAGTPYESLKTWPTFFLSPAASDDLRAELDGIFRKVDGEALAWLQKALMTRPDSTDALAMTHVPILLERGADDATCSLDMLQAWKNIAPHARIAEIANAGHFVANEQPAALAEELVELYMQAAVAF